MTAAVTIQLSTFAALTNTEPRAVTVAWEKLAERLQKHVERTKKGGDGWSPAVYRKGGTRSN